MNYSITVQPKYLIDDVIEFKLDSDKHSSYAKIGTIKFVGGWTRDGVVDASISYYIHEQVRYIPEENVIRLVERIIK